MASARGNQEPEIPFVDGIPMPPPVRPVIIVSGSDYELGYQYFQQLVEIYGTWIPSQKWGYLYYCMPLHRERFSAEELIALKRFESNIRTHTPEWIEILNGMAAGATDAGVPLTYEDLLAFFVLYEELYHWSPKSFVMPGPSSLGDQTSPRGRGPACSAFAAWGKATKDGKLLCAGSGDDNAGFFASTVVVFPETGNNFITSPYDMPGFGGFPSHPGMNNQGLVYVHHGTGRFATPNWGYTVPRGMADMHFLRFADTAEQAAEMHLSYPKAVNYKDGNFLADIGGNALVIESRDPAVIRKAGDLGETDFLYCTNNYQSRDMGDAERQDYVPHGGWINKELQGLEAMDLTAWSVSRNLFMWNMLHNYPGRVDVEFAKMMYRFPSTIAYPTLEEADAAYRPEIGKSYRARIGSLDNSVIGIVRPDNGDNGSYYVCSGPATRATGPAMPTLHNYGPRQTYSFYELKLAAGPRAVAKAALSRAQNDLYYANTAIAGLTFVEAAVLEAAFDIAKTEYFKGHYYLNAVLAGRVTGDRESVRHYAKATRAFTRCQVYAHQVCEAIAPPPSRPEDLGLEPWRGAWGDWDTYFEE
jgi:hypothetical protein